MVEACYRKPGTRYVHPLLDWQTSDIWAHIRGKELPVVGLYAEGQRRVGCVLCPMTRNVEQQMARWPGITRLWRRMADVAWTARQLKPNLKYRHPDAESYWRWWLDRDAPAPTDEFPLEDDTPMSAACGDDQA